MLRYLFRYRFYILEFHQVFQALCLRVSLWPGDTFSFCLTVSCAPSRPVCHTVSPPARLRHPPPQTGLLIEQPLSTAHPPLKGSYCFLRTLVNDFLSSLLCLLLSASDWEKFALLRIFDPRWQRTCTRSVSCQFLDCSNLNLKNKQND